MVTFPSTLGGGNWNGLAYDPSLGLVFTNVMNLGQVATNAGRKDRSGGATYVRATPWGGAGRALLESGEQDSVFGAAVWRAGRGERQHRRHRLEGADWRRRGVEGEGVREHRHAEHGRSDRDGERAGFVGATIDGYFRAFDSKSGKQLWETKLEASAHSIPMTFMGKDGKQYVVVAAGGGSFLGSAPGTKIVSFALPGPSSR